MKIYFDTADFETFVRTHVGKLYDGYRITDVEFTGRYGTPELTVTLERTPTLVAESSPLPTKNPSDEDIPILMRNLIDPT